MNEDLIEYKIITKLEDKEKIKDNFFIFFNEVYNRKLNPKSWKHQFMHFPYNNSPLILAFHNNKIIGSALMINQKIKVDKEIFNYYLFTTSAILKEYRSKGIYSQLLKIQKEHSLRKKIDFILAFPNELAYPILKLFARFKDLDKINLVETVFSNLNVSGN